MTGVNLLRAMPDRGARTEPIGGSRYGGLARRLLLVFTACGIGLWAWAIRAETVHLTDELTRARHEMSRLRPILAQAKAIGLESHNLQQRVEALEALRVAQRAPMRLLGEISRALPDDCWLTGMTDDRADVVQIDGAGFALSSLFAFVERLQRSGAFSGGVEVLESHAKDDPDGDLIAFSLKAFRHPPTAVSTPPAARRRTPPSTRVP